MSKRKSSVTNLRQRFESSSDDAAKPRKSYGPQVSVMKRITSQLDIETPEQNQESFETSIKNDRGNLKESKNDEVTKISDVDKTRLDRDTSPENFNTNENDIDTAFLNNDHIPSSENDKRNVQKSRILTPDKDMNRDIEIIEVKHEQNENFDHGQGQLLAAVERNENDIDTAFLNKDQIQSPQNDKRNVLKSRILTPDKDVKGDIEIIEVKHEENENFDHGQGQLLAAVERLVYTAIALEGGNKNTFHGKVMSRNKPTEMKEMERDTTFRDNDHKPSQQHGKSNIQSCTFISDKDMKEDSDTIQVKHEENEKLDHRHPQFQKAGEKFEIGTAIVVQNKDHRSSEQHNISKIRSQTLSSDKDLKVDNATIEVKHKENEKVDDGHAPVVLAVEKITKVFNATINNHANDTKEHESITDEHSDTETESILSMSSPHGSSRASTFDSGLSDDKIHSDDAETVIAVDRIESMVEVYKSVIKEHVKVTEIIGQLEFIGARERDIILSKHKWCPSDAIERLINEIKNSSVKSKWQTFLQALKLKGFQDISLLIEEKKETYYVGHIKLLHCLTHELEERLEFLSFIDKIFEKELLTEGDKSSVEARCREYGEHVAIRHALDLIVKQANWSKILITIFDDLGLGDIAEMFEFSMPKTQDLSMQETSIPSTKCPDSISKVEEWQSKHVHKISSKDSVKLKVNKSVQVGESHKLNLLEESLPTSKDIVNLTLEIRKLRKMGERQRSQAEISEH